MGRCVLDVASRDPRFEVVAALTRSDDKSCHSVIHFGDNQSCLTDRLVVPCDVLIDFTVGSGTLAWLSVCEAQRIPMIIGATGHHEPASQRIRQAATALPIVQAGNFSTGISAIVGFLAKLSEQLGDSYDVEIVETHHRHKADAPSGTAWSLADEILAAKGRTRADVIHGRQGQTGERPKGPIAIHSVRMGDVVGQHEIHFSAPGETLTIRHMAHSREVFAVGALRAAAWVIGRPPGLYCMGDVIASPEPV